MRFVIINERRPRGSSTCAHCGKSIARGYLRDLTSHLPYCDHACFLAQDTTAARIVSPIGAGIDGLAIRDFPGTIDVPTSVLGGRG